MGFCGVFEIEKCVEETGGLHEALGLSAFCFWEAELIGHDVADLIDDSFWNAHLEADGVEVLIDGVARGVEGCVAFFYFLGNECFMIFTKNKGKEEGGMDAELSFAPAVHLFEGLDNPVVTLGIFIHPVTEGGEHGTNEVGFFEPVIDFFGVPAEKEFLDFFIHARGAGLFK